jgi:hypothetical protein
MASKPESPDFWIKLAWPAFAVIADDAAYSNQKACLGEREHWNRSDRLKSFYHQACSEVSEFPIKERIPALIDIAGRYCG